MTEPEKPVSPEPRRIDQLHAFIALDPNDPNTEGLPAIKAGDYLMPLVGADQERVDDLRKAAQFIADTTGATLTLATFENRRDIEQIKPREDPKNV